jgi:hypothetical protein
VFFGQSLLLSSGTAHFVDRWKPNAAGFSGGGRNHSRLPPAPPSCKPPLSPPAACKRLLRLSKKSVSWGLFCAPRPFFYRARSACRRLTNGVIRLCHPAAGLARIGHAPGTITMPTHGRSPRSPRPFSHSRSLGYARFAVVDATGAPPLHVDGDLPPPRQAISARWRTNGPKDWCHHGAPLTVARSCVWRLSLRDHRL